MKIFVCFGNLDFDLQLDEKQKKRAVKIIELFSEKVKDLKSVEFLYAGRKSSYSSFFFQSLKKSKGDKWCKNHVATYVPKILGDIDENEFEFFGRKLIRGQYIEDRRYSIVNDCDLMLISGGGRAIHNFPKIAKKLNKPIIPLPIGFQEVISDEFSFFSKKYARSTIKEQVMIVEDRSTEPEEIAEAYFRIVEAFCTGKVNKGTAFLTMPFVDSFLNRDDAEDAFIQVCNESGYEPIIVKDTDGQEPIINEIVDGIEISNIVVAYLDENRPNVYFESGIAKGLGKPLILCYHESCKTAFDTRAFENIRWSSIRQLRESLSAKFKQLKDSKKIPS